MTQQFWMFWLPDHQTLYGFGNSDLAMRYQAYLKAWGNYNVTEVPEDVTSDLLDLNKVVHEVA